MPEIGVSGTYCAYWMSLFLNVFSLHFSLQLRVERGQEMRGRRERGNDMQQKSLDEVEMGTLWFPNHHGSPKIKRFTDEMFLSTFFFFLP